MSVTHEARMGIALLRRLLHDADAAALLVPPRLLRRVIKRDRHLGGLGLQVPHRKTYTIARDTLLGLVDRDELGVGPDRELPPVVLLLAAPEREALAAQSRGAILVKYWRLLFHARVHAAIAEQRLTEAAVRERIHRIGQTEFDEARNVLRQEKYLLPPHDNRTVYEEFAAVYLELSHFTPTLLPRYFPTLDDYDRIDRTLAEDVDAAALFAATRPAGASDPDVLVDAPGRAVEPAFEATGATTLPRSASNALYRGLMSGADRAAGRGNAVRAAIRRYQAALVAPPGLTDEIKDRAAAELFRLVERLRVALHLSDAEAETWRVALPVLLPRAARSGWWPPEARLLYDLQKVCVDHERPVFAPDVVEWAYSQFRRPLVRPLPDQPLVLAVKHLRGAADRLAAVRISEDERSALAILLHRALHHAEGRLRERFRPLFGEAIVSIGLEPQNLPERVARAKLVEELLDRVVERGFLNMGDLRDALSRNQLKLPDLVDAKEFFGGDPLLRANRELATRAPGVYRRGEIYLRWLQRLSSLAFGTPGGRLLTLNLILPFGGAFLAIEGPLQIVHEVRRFFRFVGRLIFSSVPETAVHQHSPFPLTPWPILLVGGICFWLLLHVPACRRLAARVVGLVGRALYGLLIEVPIAVLRWPSLRRLLESAPVQLFGRLVLKPLPLSALAWIVLIDTGLEPHEAALGGGAAFLVATLFLHSRLGRDMEEIATDWTVRRWEYLRDYVPGVLRLVADLFKRFLEALDRLLYTVDEWLRFRSGEGRLTLIWKTAAGLLWGGVAYLLRFVVVLFIEPQINPLKHFPVVTVSHKLLLPLIPSLTAVLIERFGWGSWEAGLIATLVIGKIPGVFGFLVWELKENWRLYRVNRPATLRPVMVGSHGETLARLLKPGFHSGTLPKLYAKLRRAERRACRSGAWRTARRLREALHHVETSVRHFAERELLPYLIGSRGWTAGPVQIVGVEAGSNRIRLEMVCPGLGNDPLELKFEEQSGWLLAHVARPGWLSRLTSEQTAVLALALTGLYKEGAVNLIREQIAAQLASLASPPYDIAADGLAVWPGPGYETEVVYDLDERPKLHPRVSPAGPRDAMPVLEASQLLFSERPVAWADWVAAWERDQNGAEPPKPLLAGIRVLPTPGAQPLV